MALIPTKRDLGPLERIQATPGFQPAQSYEGAALANLGRTVQQVGGVVSDIAAQKQREREEAQRFAMSQSIQQLEIQSRDDIQQATDRARPDGFGLQTDAVGSWQKRADVLYANTPEWLKERVKPILDTQRVVVEQRAGVQELEKRNGWFRAGIAETTDRAQNSVFENPASIAEQRANVLASIETSSLPADEKEKLKREAFSAVGKAKFMRTLQDDPAAAAAGLGVRYAQQSGDLVGAVIRQESGGDSNAVSPKGASGLMQVMPATGAEIAREIGDADFPAAGTVAQQQAYLKDPAVSQRYGSHYLNKMLERYDGDQAAALIAYNGGPARADAWLASGRDDSTIPDESANYYKKVLGFAEQAAGMAVPAVRAPIDVAKAFLGATAGRDGKVISAFIEKATGQKVDPKQTAWCAHWLNAVFQSQGVEGTGSGMARSFLNFGTAVDEPEVGDVAVFSRGSGNVYGHVGIVAGKNVDGSLQILGGNQRKSVSVATYGRDKVLGFRRPPNVSTPEGLAVENAKLPGGGPAQGIEIGEPEADYADITFADRMTMMGQARREMDRRFAEDRLQTKSFIEGAMENAPVAITNTGAYTGAMPSEDQFRQAYGDLEGSQKFSQFAASVDVATKSHDMQTMPAAQIQEMLAAAAPRGTGAEAALEQKRYDALSQAAAATLKSREADPSSYVRQAFPAVGQAWEGVGDGFAGATYRDALRLTADAQTALGIPTDRQALLPKEAASSIVSTFKDVNAAEPDRVNAVINSIFSTPDRGQQQAIFQQLVKSGLPDITEGALEAAARGDAAAAQRLMRAALVDPTKLPGKTDVKDGEIDQAIQDDIMADGELGDAIYGLSSGTTQNYERATRDSDLITRSIKLRVREGQDLDEAVAGVKKDLYGDMKVFTGGYGAVAMLAVPEATDNRALGQGLERSLPMFRAQLERQAESVLKTSRAPTADGGRAILAETTKNEIARILDAGEFRSVDNGVGLFDAMTGTFVAGPDGKPFVLSLSDILAPVADAPGPEAEPLVVTP